MADEVLDFGQNPQRRTSLWLFPLSLYLWSAIAQMNPTYLYGPV